MPDININQILGAPNLCGIIQDTTSGVPNPFKDVPGFLEVTESVDGDYGEYTVLTGTRTTAKISAYGSTSSNRQLRNLGVRPVKLISTVENIILPAHAYINLLDYNSLKKQEMGATEVARQIREARRNLDNLRIASAASAVFAGNIYFDAVGNLLPASSAGSATTTVPFNVPAGNLNQLNALGDGNIIDVKWSDTSARIDKQIMALHQAAVRLTGYDIKHAFYGKNIANYLTSNTSLSNYFYRNGDFNPKYIQTGDIPNPLLDLTWHKAYYSFFEDASGVNRSLIDDDTVVFTPDPAEWYGLMEGSIPIPKAFNFNGNDPMQNFQISHGMYAYGVPMNDPAGAKIVYGDTFLPVIKNPKCLFIAKVVF